MTKIPPPSEPSTNKKENSVSVRLSDSELVRFKETVSIYKSLHKSRYKIKGIGDSDVLRAAIEVLRKALDSEIAAKKSFKNEFNVDFNSNFDDDLGTVPRSTDDNFDP